MNTVGDVNGREDRPAYVRFEIVPVEDKAASEAAGHYVGRDVEFALITPPYSKDIFKIKVPQWKLNMKQDVANGRLPEAWMDKYLEAYSKWKAGQEIPLNGTPIKGWGVISPSQQEMLIRMNILTVEDLSRMTMEGLQRIGMGAVDLKNKATGWLAQLNDKGPLTQKIAAVMAENDLLKNSVESLQKQVEKLMEHARNGQPPAPVESVGIAASDILDDGDITEQYTKKFGKPPHHRMKPESIAAALQE